MPVEQERWLPYQHRTQHSALCHSNEVRTQPEQSQKIKVCVSEICIFLIIYIYTHIWIVLQMSIEYKDTCSDSSSMFGYTNPSGRFFAPGS